MRALARIPVLRSIMAMLIALALLAAPLQFSGAAQTTSGMTMPDSNCPPKESCCDMDKPNCNMTQDCIAKCGSTPGLAFQNKVDAQLESENGGYFFATLSLKAQAYAPLRRPPRN